MKQFVDGIGKLEFVKLRLQQIFKGAQQSLTMLYDGTGIPRATIFWYLEKFKYGQPLERKHRSWQCQIFSADEWRRLTQFACRDDMKNGQELQLTMIIKGSQGASSKII